MNTKIWFISLFIFCLTPLISQACPPRNLNSLLAYSRRDDNRCEGIKPRNISTSSGLVSFSTGQLNKYSDLLRIHVPGLRSSEPEIILQSFQKNYLLDQLTTELTEQGNSFNLNTQVLKDAKVSPKSLHAKAFVRHESQKIFFPVVLEKPSGQYIFVIKITRLKKIEIRKKGDPTVIFEYENKTSRIYTKFAWEYGNNPAGLYELRITLEEDKIKNFLFQHDPEWFDTI